MEKDSIKLAFVFIIVFAAAVFNGNAQEIQQRRGPQIVSPDISADNHVSFNIYSENAQSVAVSGSWLVWRNDLKNFALKLFR